MDTELSSGLPLMGLTVLMRRGKVRTSEGRYSYVVLPTRTEIVRSLMLTELSGGWAFC